MQAWNSYVPFLKPLRTYMKEQIETLMNKFLIQLLEINADTLELNKLNALNLLSEKTIAEVRELLKENQFANDQEEIDFFKIINPKILSPSIEQ